MTIISFTILGCSHSPTFIYNGGLIPDGTSVVYGKITSESTLHSVNSITFRTKNVKKITDVIQLDDKYYFYWILPKGDYVLQDFMRREVSVFANEIRDTSWRLNANFSVTGTAKAVYIGDFEFVANRNKLNKKVLDNYTSTTAILYDKYPEFKNGQIDKNLIEFKNDNSGGNL
ncbi:MAG TPA: hypothetical protein VF828_04325 [Patescibacteria group bacterium]